MEIEAKIPEANLERIRAKLETLGCELLQPELHERNIRYDDVDGRLNHAHQVLRLRDNGGQAIVTFKGPNRDLSVAVREEIETEVADFDTFAHILEALGYQPIFIYEKYRSIYRFGKTLVMLDRVPIGTFVEIEGPDEETIRNTALSLNLNWDGRTTKSYQRLFLETSPETRDMVF